MNNYILYCNYLKPPNRLGAWLAFLVLSFCHFGPVNAQNHIFASLTGSPVMDTIGWEFSGNAHLGNTLGGFTGQPNARDELILTDPINFTSGACFYKKPLNLGNCQKWVAEYEYRIYDGTGADGLAFCFLESPPQGFVLGGGLGIPSKPRGLMVAIDPWRNGQCMCDSVPKLELVYGTGKANYSECPGNGITQPTICSFSLARNTRYNKIKVSYNNGFIQVYVNNSLMLSGVHSLNFNGYFGFTASTGSVTDRHSIRNFYLKTWTPVYFNPEIPNDVSVCRNNPITIGTKPNNKDPFTYTWSPSTGLSDPNSPNPVLVLDNNTNKDQTLYYYRTLNPFPGMDTICFYSNFNLIDTIKVVVSGRFVSQSDTDTLHIFYGEHPTLNLPFPAYIHFDWKPNDGSLNDVTLSNPSILLTNSDSVPFTKQWYVRAKNTESGCADSGTVHAVFYPKFTGTITNIITANQDGKNEYWTISKLNLYPDHEVTILNRWGKQIFKASPYKQDWDGNGYPAGTYFYIIRIGNQYWRGILELIK